MTNNFLKEIEIVEFKCFKNFHVNNLKRVNLISGKNNVGKTALMEALFINISSKKIESMIHSIYSIKYSRDNLEYIFKQNSNDLVHRTIENTKIFNVKTNIVSSFFTVKNKDGVKEYYFKLNENEKSVNVNNFSLSSEYPENTLYIDNFGLTNDNLKYIYEFVQKNDSEEQLNSYIKKFDNTIENFKIIGGNKPQCKSSTYGEYVDINEFGDGLKHYISIVCALYACKNGYLFIDEIDNGIHYTQLEKLWELIFKISKEVNCQVFATTHSKEMITAFAKVSKKLDDQDICFIELGRNKENEIKANVYDQEMFLNEIKQNHEVRGW